MGEIGGGLSDQRHMGLNRITGLYNSPKLTGMWPSSWPIRMHRNHKCLELILSWMQPPEHVVRYHHRSPPTKILKNYIFINKIDHIRVNKFRYFTLIIIRWYYIINPLTLVRFVYYVNTEHYPSLVKLNASWESSLSWPEPEIGGDPGCYDAAPGTIRSQPREHQSE